MSDVTTTSAREADASTDRDRARGLFAYRLAGYFFFALFAGISASFQGLQIRQIGPMDAAASGELNLWLAHAVLLVPGCFLLGIGYSESVFRLLQRTARRLRSMERTQAALAASCLFAFATAVAWLGHSYLLLGYPITDDEYAAQFGGRILASGHLAIPVPDFAAAFPLLFLHLRDGMIAGGDFLGVQLAWAVAELTGLGAFVWVLAAATTTVAVAATAAKRLGYEWGAAAAAMFLVSPMALALSFTTHAHAISRCFVAVAILLYVVADRSGRTRDWAFAGLAAGAAICCRPAESAAIFIPFAVFVVYRALRGERDARTALLGLSVGALAPTALFLAHNAAVTGAFWLPPALSPNLVFDAKYTPGTPILQGEQLLFSATVWERFGRNTSYNALLLAVWSLGPVGVALAIAGFSRDRFTKLLGAGVLASLAVGLVQYTVGVHTVGPIHYSECVVPITILAAHGFERTVGAARRIGYGLAEVSSGVVLSLALGLGTCNLVNFVALWSQAGIQRDTYARLEASLPAAEKVVVIAPTFGDLWQSDLVLGNAGSWVFAWRRPHPDFRDRVLIFHDSEPALDALRRSFPDRAFYRVSIDRQGEPFPVTPVP